MPEISFAERHKEARTRCGLRQEDVAALCNVKRVTVSSWEIGKNQTPEVPVLLKLCDLYLTSVDWLLGYADAEMVHSVIHGARPLLLEYLQQHSQLGANAPQLAVAWLMEHYPTLCTEEALVRRLGVPASVIRYGNMSGPAIDNLAELTGIPQRFWATGDPADLPPAPADGEAARLLALLTSTEPPISVDVVRRALGYLRGLALESK